MKCFWQTGCSDSARCRKFGQCIAAHQNAHKADIARPLNKIVDVVLAYRPKPKSKPARKRARRRKQAQSKSSI